MDEDFNIELEQYTPPPSELSLPSPAEYPSESRYVNDYYTEQAISSSMNDANGSGSGWLNSVANLLPGITKVIKSIVNPSGSTNPSGSPNIPVQYGVSSQTRQGSIASPASQKSSQNMMLYLIIGGIAIFLLFFMRK